MNIEDIQAICKKLPAVTEDINGKIICALI
jgi:hypothetical protein